MRHSLNGKGEIIAGAIIAIHKVAASAEVSGHVEIQFNAVLQAGELEWVQAIEIRRSPGPGRGNETRHGAGALQNRETRTENISTCLLKSPVKPPSYRWQCRRRAVCL